MIAVSRPSLGNNPPVEEVCPLPAASVDVSAAREACSAKDALSASKYVPLRKLTCQVTEGVVEIQGQVPSFYLKQLAQEAVLHLYPHAEVRNLVQVGQRKA